MSMRIVVCDGQQNATQYESGRGMRADWWMGNQQRVVSVAPDAVGMKAKAALAATMVRMPPMSTVLRARMDVLALALMGALRIACTSMQVDVNAGSCERPITCCRTSCEVGRIQRRDSAQSGHHLKYFHACEWGQTCKRWDSQCKPTSY